MKLLRNILIMVLGFAITSAYAEVTQIGRYITAEDGPKTDQMYPLKQVIQMKLPLDVQTVGQALAYILKPSGYSLVPEDKQSAPLKIILSKPVPEVDRNIGPIVLKEELSVLIGPVFNLVEDPLNRMVDFKVKPAYAHLYDEKATKNSNASGAKDKAQQHQDNNKPSLLTQSFFNSDKKSN